MLPDGIPFGAILKLPPFVLPIVVDIFCLLSIVKFCILPVTLLPNLEKSWINIYFIYSA